MIPYGAKKFAIKNGKPRASGDDPESAKSALAVVA